MELNYIAILAATIAQFIIGFIWYMPLFGKAWGEIHGFNEVSPEVQKEMQKKMMPLLVVQFLGTVVTSFVFALFLAGMPAEWNIYGMAGFFWLGFVAPTQISAVIFGGTKPEWVMKKSLISIGGSFCTLMGAALVFSLF
jgi:hypothetical protein